MCKLHCNGVVKGVNLSQVLYIPELEANLMSVGCLIGKGADVSYNKTGCIFPLRVCIGTIPCCSSSEAQPEMYSREALKAEPS